MADKAKILIAEDNDFVRMQIVKFLQDEGYSTVETTDGLQAMNLMNPEIDLAIVDVRMEPVDGFEFIKNMRSRDLKAPIVLVTGDKDPDLLHDAQALGVGAVLLKPVEKDRLVKTVDRAIQVARRGG